MKFKQFYVFLMLLMAVSAIAQQSDFPQQPQRIIRVSSGVAEGLLKHKVEPQYPQEAKFNNITGDVLLQIIIDKEGNVTKIKPLRGHPVLSASAIDAVKQWKYKPYLLNESPEVVETTVTIKFHIR
jgi:periplasmic protein TonB